MLPKHCISLQWGRSVDRKKTTRALTEQNGDDLAPEHVSVACHMLKTHKNDDVTMLRGLYDKTFCTFTWNLIKTSFINLHFEIYWEYSSYMKMEGENERTLHLKMSHFLALMSGSWELGLDFI